MKHARRSRRSNKGVMLIDALAALAVMGIGILGIGVLQGRTLEAGTESQRRVLAGSVADELVAIALVDPDNGACYQVPAASSGCSNETAATAARLWSEKAARTLPAGAVAKAAFDGQRLHVTLTWPSKTKAETRTLEAVTDVRP